VLSVPPPAFEAMSMIGGYVRLTPADLDRALSDPEWACEYADDLRDTEYETEPDIGQARCHDIDKTWHALGFLLRRLRFPVDIVFGEEPVPGATNCGYGPPVTARRNASAWPLKRSRP
jgi:hypothetical protein